MTQPQPVSSGVQELIDKLKNDGVIAGQEKADQLIKEAQNEASRIVAKAKLEADKLVSDATKKINQEKESAHEAIQIAFRDTELSLRSKVREAFSDQLRHLVSLELQDTEFIKQLILAVVGFRAHDMPQDQKAEIVVPSQLFEEDSQGTRLSQEGKQSLRHFVLGISDKMLRAGIELKPSPDFAGGIKVRLVGKDLEMDFSDEAISTLLLKYLLPRFRAIVAGEE